VFTHDNLCLVAFWSLQDAGGDEDWHLYVQAVDSSSPSRDLTPFKVGMQQLQAQQPEH
jgi:hypothetical protein